MSFDLVFFGGTGDLAWRKLMPALFQAFRHGKLPPGGRILAVARDERSDASTASFIARALQRGGPLQAPQRRGVRAASPQLLHYRRMDLSQPDALRRPGRMASPSAALNTVVLYLATSPHLFPVICEQLGAAGLNGPTCAWCWRSRSATTWPAHGRSTAWCSAVFSEKQAFRIDHYLGKPSVQNLMALRFGNALFEPLWRRESIANIQITLAEAWAWAPAATSTTAPARCAT
jgi:glucose-6-phosphate 1-dehydrogenase